MDYTLFYDIHKGEPDPEDRYNQYFNPNICHVCKKPDDRNLRTCWLCGLISYCCDEHMILDEELHIDLCAAMLLITPLVDPGLSICFEFDDWMELRKNIITYLKEYIQRDLKPYEIEMIMCAKSCFYCHKRTDLQTCNKCYSINYCSNHIADFKEQHTTCPEEFFILLVLNFLSMKGLLDLKYPNIMFTTFPGSKPYSDMTTFLNKYVLNYGHKKQILGTGLYTYSDYMSNPLTLYYACEKLNISHILSVTDTFVIHILAADTVDVIGLKAWELLKHLFRNIKEIRVVMIKSETIFESYEYKDTCAECRNRNLCEFYFENVTMSYHDYVNTASYKRPNVIIGSLPRFITAGVWRESSQVILSQKCPILFTARSQNQIKEMENLLNSKMFFENRFFGENEYCGLRPYRDYDTGGIVYHNRYILFLEFKLLPS